MPPTLLDMCAKGLQCGISLLRFALYVHNWLVWCSCYKGEMEM